MSRVLVRLLDDAFLEQLLTLGFSSVGDARLNTFSKSVPEQNAKVKVLVDLRDYGVCFSGGAAWSPSEVFEYLRDQGLLIGSYRRVEWSGPGRFTITENC